METNQSRQHVPYSDDVATRLIASEAAKPGPLLVIFHRLQETFGYVDERDIARVAHALNISEAEVYGVLSFYRDFRRTASEATSVRICRAEACQAMGAEELMAHAQTSLGIACGEETIDGAVRLEQAFCFGNCALSPAVMIEDRLYGRVSTDRFDALVQAVRLEPEL